MANAAPPLVAPQAPATVEALCGAGCGAALTARQIAKGARHCSPGCRVRVHRAKRKAAVLGRLDALAGELARLRADVERW